MKNNPEIQWINPKTCRYFSVRIERDLLGDLVFSTFWGGLKSRLGGVKHLAVQSDQEAMDCLKSIYKTRLSRGYQIRQTDGTE